MWCCKHCAAHLWRRGCRARRQSFQSNSQSSFLYPRSRIQAVMGFLHRVVGVSLGEMLSHLGEIWNRTAAPERIKGVSWCGLGTWLGCLPKGGIPGLSDWEETSGKTQDGGPGGVIISWLGLEAPGDPSVRVSPWGWGKGSLRVFDKQKTMGGNKNLHDCSQLSRLLQSLTWHYTQWNSAAGKKNKPICVMVTGILYSLWWC